MRAEAELEIEQELYEDMDMIEGGQSNGGLVIIIAVVVLGLIGTGLFTLHMMTQNKNKRIAEANAMQLKIMKLSDQNQCEEFGNVEVKQKTSMMIKKLHKQDNLVGDESAEQPLDKDYSSPLDGIIEYGDQFNPNHDFAIF